MTSHICRDKSLDIRAAVTYPPVYFDKWAATSVSAFSVERSQTASEEFELFQRL